MPPINPRVDAEFINFEAKQYEQATVTPLSPIRKPVSLIPQSDLSRLLADL